MKAERAWMAGAAGLALAAVAASLHMGLSAGRHREILGRKAGDLARIEQMANRWAREDAYRARLESLGAWQPADLDALAASTIGAGAVRLSPRPAVPAADGWQRREVAVEIPQAAYAEAVRFFAAAADTLPAWRLKEIELRPSAEAGSGSLTAVLEALEKKQP